MAEFISLYSGSSGNSSVVRCGSRYLIVDMGKGVRTPLPMSTIRYRLPQRTTLLLPEEPEYNEMNSAMKNLLLLMKTARRRIRQAVGFVQTCCGYRACSSAAGTRSTLLMSAPRPRSFSTMFS